MFKLNLTFLISSFILLGSIHCDRDWSGDKKSEKWMKNAKENIDRLLQRKLNGNLAKNIVFFLGDGMGLPSVTAGRILKGQLKGNNGEEEITFMESLDHVGLSKTYNIDAQTADSAGTATAYLSGVKTRIGSIGVSGEAVDCKTSLSSKIESILQWAYYAGMSTGIVTTARVTHATPAGAYAHVPDRDWESFDGLNFNSTHAEQGCKDIAAQLIDENSYINLVMGGGRMKFLGKNAYALNATYSEAGDRIDNRNLIEEWKNLSKDHKFIWTRNEFESLKPNQYKNILALFTSNHMAFEIDRNSAEEPSIIEMTKKAIELLSVNPKGYFLLVEGGKIDHGHHESRAQKALRDFVVFDDAISQALSQTNRDDSLITVTADHSHVFTIGGYSVRGNDIFGLNRNKYSNVSDAKLTYTGLLYGNGPGFVNVNRTTNLTDSQTKDKNYVQESAVYLSSETHGGEDVAVYSSGPMSYLFDGTFEQSYIAHVMAYSSCIGPYNNSACKLNRGVYISSDAIQTSFSILVLLNCIFFMLLVNN